MGGRILCILMMMTLCSQIRAQDVSRILLLAGVESPEQMDPEEFERMERYLLNPLRINMENRSVLLSSGLFTPFQVASLMDYRSRHGDVLSWTELSALDGFNETSVSLLKPFISLDSRMNPGERSGKPWCRNELSLRSGYRISDSHDIQYGLKYSFEYGSMLKVNAGLSAPYSSPALPSNYSLSVSHTMQRLPLKVIAGDFNARFGQGLVMWNGMTMSGLTSPSSFLKRASFMSQPSTYTGSSALTGLAASYSPGRFNVSLAAAAPGIKTATPTLMPLMNVAWLGRFGHISMTGYWTPGVRDSKGVREHEAKTSVDVGFCIKGTDVFAEAAYDWYDSCLAALAGVVFPIGEKALMGMIIRHYPATYRSTYSGAVRSTSKCTDETAVTLGSAFRNGRFSQTISADAAYFPQSRSKDEDSSWQFKMLGEWGLAVSDDLTLSLRFSERVRSWGEPLRTDVRADLGWTVGRFLANVRLNALFCKETGLLGYLEGGYDSDMIKFYLRGGVFFIDNWDDRIYAYERDAPGSFSVPAYYGRGLWTALYARATFTRSVRMYLRAAYTAYPFMEQEKRKPGRAELKLSFAFLF